MQPGRYTFSRNIIALGLDYTVTDADGRTVLTIDGKLRFAATFTVLDPDDRVLFSGKEHVLNLDQRFEFERDGILFATMVRELVGKVRVVGESDYRYVATLRTGERFVTSGYVQTAFSVSRDGATVARVERDLDEFTFDLEHEANGAFLMAMAVAVVRLNRAPRVGSPSD